MCDRMETIESFIVRLLEASKDNYDGSGGNQLTIELNNTSGKIVVGVSDETTEASVQWERRCFSCLSCSSCFKCFSYFC